MIAMITSTLGELGKVCMCKRIMKEQTSPVGDIPFYKISTFGEKADCYISREIYEDYKTRFSFPKKGDILISAAGTIGRIVVYDGKDAFFQDSNIVWIDNDETKVLNEYLYYFFRTNPWVKTFGSTIPRLYNDNIRSVSITYPMNLDDQRDAVRVMRMIDSKIANNNDICADLEAMAKLLYDYWFVQFDFPDENGKPYKSSGGKMVWNEDLKREIPEGWEVGNLYDIASFINGLACQNYRPVDDNRKLPVIKIGEMHNGIGADVEWARDDVPQKNIIDNGDILFSWSASLEVMLWNKGKGVLNQHIFKVVPQKYDKYYVYQQLAGYIINFVKMAEARKTTMGHITTDHLKQSRIPLPPIELSKMYGKYVEDIYGEFLNCSVENEQLASLRDFLLPMLMNGQVKISAVK